MQAPGDAQVFMPNLSPLNLMTGGESPCSMAHGAPNTCQPACLTHVSSPACHPGSLFSGGQNWGQQYVQKVQQRMSWLSGGALSFHFSVTNSYGEAGMLRCKKFRVGPTLAALLFHSSGRAEMLASGTFRGEAPNGDVTRHHQMAWHQCSFVPELRLPPCTIAHLACRAGHWLQTVCTLSSYTVATFTA
jgi:hypothetical protein